MSRSIIVPEAVDPEFIDKEVILTQPVPSIATMASLQLAVTPQVPLSADNSTQRNKLATAKRVEKLNFFIIRLSFHHFEIRWEIE